MCSAGHVKHETLSHTHTPFLFCAASPGTLNFPGNGHSFTWEGRQRCCTGWNKKVLTWERLNPPRSRKATAQTWTRNSYPFMAGPEDTVRSAYKKSFSLCCSHNCWNRDTSIQLKITVDVDRTVCSEPWLAVVSGWGGAWASPQSLSPQKVFCLCSPFSVHPFLSVSVIIYSSIPRAYHAVTALLPKAQSRHCLINEACTTEIMLYIAMSYYT